MPISGRADGAGRGQPGAGFSLTPGPSPGGRGGMWASQARCPFFARARLCPPTCSGEWPSCVWAASQ
jgi:hypothetical protein